MKSAFSPTGQKGAVPALPESDGARLGVRGRHEGRGADAQHGLPLRRVCGHFPWQTAQHSSPPLSRVLRDLGSFAHRVSGAFLREDRASLADVSVWFWVEAAPPDSALRPLTVQGTGWDAGDHVRVGCVHGKGPARGAIAPALYLIAVTRACPRGAFGFPILSHSRDAPGPGLRFQCGGSGSLGCGGQICLSVERGLIPASGLPWSRLSWDANLVAFLKNSGHWKPSFNPQRRVPACVRGSPGPFPSSRPESALLPVTDSFQAVVL